MKRFTKFFLAALALTFSANLAAQEEVVYYSCGYDMKANKMVNFKWTAEGFESVDAPEGQNLSPLSYIKNKQLYTLAGDVDIQTLTVMDAEKFTQVSQVSGPLNAATGLPLALFASDQQPFATFAIASVKEEGLGVRYYTAVLDENTVELKRISTIGYWYDDETMTSIAPLAFFCSYGTGYVVYAKRQDGQTKTYLGRLDVMTGVITETGVIEAVGSVDPLKAVASVYDVTTTYRYYLVISPDGEQNSTIYYLPTFATNGQVAAAKEAEADRVLAGCYQRPSTIAVYGTPTVPMAEPDDVEIEIDGTKITVTFTVPLTDIKGDTLKPDNWALTADYGRAINAYVYMEGSTVTTTKPEGVTYFFPGDKATLTGDLSTVYGVTNPNGLHCFTLRLQPAGGYTGWTICYHTTFALVGSAKPEPVKDAKVEMTDANKGLFSWTAPTATEYGDWGYEFDGSDLTYTIVRNIDGVVVADGLTGTSAEVDNLAKEPGNFDFSIYAVAGGTQSSAAMTNSVYCEPPTYDFLGYNTSTGSITAFNIDETFTHTDWMTNTNIGNEVGFVRGSKLFTTKYTYTYNSYNPNNSNAMQFFSIFTAEKFEQQGYNYSNYWYPNNGAVIRHLLTAAYDPQQDRVFGVAVDTVRNADYDPIELKYYVVDVDTVGNYQLQNRIVDVLGRWSLVDETKDAKAVLAVAVYNKKIYATVANREGGKVSYELCTFNPMKLTLDKVAAINLPIGIDYGFQFFISATDALYLGYNDGQNNTALYEISTADGRLTKMFDMDGIYTYAYQKPSLVSQPAKKVGSFAAPTFSYDAETGKGTAVITLPTLFADGSSIDEETRVRIYVDGEQKGMSSSVAAGSEVEVSFNITEGLHLLTYVAFCTWSPSIATSNLAANVIVGPAKPNAPTNAVAEMFGDNEAQITWTAPTASVWADWGATITEEDVLTYMVVQNQEQKTLVSDCPDLEYYAEEVATYGGMYDFTIYAINGTQKSEGVVTNLVEVIGEPNPTAIDAVSTAKVTTTAIYNEAGQPVSRLQRGVNIVRRADGKTVKLFVK
ncbi:MAG: hypothetical protein IJV45_07045 [Prevotella sp.]|nr:hypothetical protein [Prevotella sp.]